MIIDGFSITFVRSSWRGEYSIFLIAVNLDSRKYEAFSFFLLVTISEKFHETARDFTKYIHQIVIFLSLKAYLFFFKQTPQISNV